MWESTLRINEYTGYITFPALSGGHAYHGGRKATPMEKESEMIMHKHYEKNKGGRDFVVGDLHGCLSALKAKLIDIDFDYGVDRMFSVGDLVDRGDDSMGCLKLIKEPWFYPVMGNHEDFMLRCIIGEDYPGLWVSNGGSWHYDEDENRLKKLCEYVESHIPFAITVETEHGRVGICHAQPPTYDWKDAVDPSEESKEVMLWSRTRISHKDATPTEGILKTIHGHTPVEEITKFGNAVYIDTGCVFGYDLTVIDL